MSVEKLRDEYIAARAHLDRVKELKKEAQGIADRAEAALATHLAENNSSSHNYKGANFILASKFRFSLSRGTFNAMTDFLLQRDKEPVDYEDKGYSRAKTKELLQEIYAEEGDEGLPKFLHINTTPGITVRGWGALAEAETRGESTDEIPF